MKKPLTKAEMEADLRKAVLNTGGALIEHDDRPLPTADHVAQVLVEASQALGCNPIALVSHGEKNNRMTPYRSKRARAYAALALFEVFPATPKSWLGRMVGSRSAKNYLHRCEDVRRSSKWWDDAIFSRVILAIRP